MTPQPNNPSIDTILLNLWLGLRERITDWRRVQLSRALQREDDIRQRLDWSIRQDLDDEADNLRDVLRSCDTAKAQAEARLTSILQYLDPDEFYTPRQQVPEGAGLDVPTEPIIDEDDAPEGYKAAPWGQGVSCADCAFGGLWDVCSEQRGESSCLGRDRQDGVEVVFVKNT